MSGVDSYGRLVVLLITLQSRLVNGYDDLTKARYDNLGTALTSTNMDQASFSTILTRLYKQLNRKPRRNPGNTEKVLEQIYRYYQSVYSVSEVGVSRVGVKGQGITTLG